MSTDLPKDPVGSGPAEPAAAPPLNELQQAILARAQETIARRGEAPPKSRTQLLVVLALTLVLAVIAFAGLNYVVGTAQRLIAEYAASQKEESSAPAAPQASGDPGVIIIQPDRTLEPPPPPPAQTQQAL